MSAGLRLLRRALPPPRSLLAVAGWSAVEALPALVGGILVAAALDRGFLRHDVLTGLGWLSVLAVAALVRAGAAYRLYPRLAGAVEPVRDALVREVVTATVRRATAGDGTGLAVVAQLGSQVETVRTLVSTLLRTLRQVATALVAAAAGLALLAPPLAALVLPPVLVAAGLYAAALPALTRRQRDLVLADEAVAGAVGTATAGVRDVVACAAVPRTMRTVGAAADAHARALNRFARLDALRSVVALIGVQLPVLLVAASAPALVRRGVVTPGEVVGVLTYLITGLGPAVRALITTLGSWSIRLRGVLHRLAEACAAVPGPPEGDLPAPRRFDLRAEGLTFAYGRRATPILQGLDLHVPEHSHLAIVGASGIGKSTLADLLSGLTAPTSGRLLVGGTPVAAIRPADLRRRIALIPQEAYVFPGTLRENVAYLRTDDAGSSTSDLDAAAVAVGLDGPVRRLGGWDARLDRPAQQLSSGERQLVALARVYLSAADIVVLDEATCHLDPAAEARAEAAFAARRGTLVVVAHRLSSARRADLVLLMDAAGPVLGSHEELTANAPAYAALVRGVGCPTSGFPRSASTS